DPLSQREYYALGAFFKGLADRVWDGNIRSPGPIAVIANDAATQRRIDDIAKNIAPLEAALRARGDELEKKLPPLAAAMEEPVDTDGAPPPEKTAKGAKGKAPAKKPVTY